MHELFFLMLFLSLSGKDPSSDGIAYRELTWSDFRGPVPEDQTGCAARTTVEMDLETTEQAGKFTYALQTHFLPYSSWVRVKSKEILRHEQSHFQIAYIWSRRCLVELERLQGGDSASRQKALDSYHLTIAKRDAENEQFDQETHHGLNPEAERAWEIRINQQLKALFNGRNR